MEFVGLSNMALMIVDIKLYTYITVLIDGQISMIKVRIIKVSAEWQLILLIDMYAKVNGKWYAKAYAI